MFAASISRLPPAGIALDQAPQDEMLRKTLGRALEATNDSLLVSPAAQKPARSNVEGAIAAVLRVRRAFLHKKSARFGHGISLELFQFMRLKGTTVKNFTHLSEREILALAIASEEDDNRVYMAFAEDLHERYPATAKLFEDMAEVEAGHFKMLTEAYHRRFGPNLVPIRRADVNFFIRRPPVWLTRNLPLKTIRKEAEIREAEAAGFYTKAAAQATDPAVARLLGELAKAEHTHEELAATIESTVLTTTERGKEEKTSNRLFVLQYVQPGLVGLMDGSVSTLAPLFAAAFATHDNWPTFLVGLAAALGAGISMGFAEALSDDGALSGRGSPVVRGAVCGMTTALGGLGHSLPYLIPNSLPNSFWIATGIAGVIVSFELWIIAWVRARYMSTPFLRAVLQIVLGGAIVLATGILIGAA